MFDSTPKLSAEEPPGREVPPPDVDLQRFVDLRRYVKSGKIPWRKISSWKRENLCNEDIVTREEVGYRNGVPFPLRSHRFTPRKIFQENLRERFADEIATASVRDLHEKHPDRSAARVLNLAQKTLFSISALLAVIALIKYPMTTIITANAAVTIYFLLAIAYRIILVFTPAAPFKTKGQLLTPDDDALPTITILLPLYHDADAMVTLSQAIDQLQYPTEKKDVKLLVEEDDAATINEARRLGLDERYELITVAATGPRTKPKACNYGMHLARGDLIVIFDAEDQPEPDQLLKAASAFHYGDDQLACVQARLNYYNANENWLTRLFTLEYSLWFDWLLPALQAQGAPIPLGGTSNYFKTDTLIKIGGWDPFNVTEDADLGLRLSKLGYRVEILDSTTYEEANCQIGNWIRQRSRWMKGYLQTWLVHMRRPGDIVATTGWSGLLSIQLFTAGNVFSALINPILWAVFVAWLLTASPLISEAFPGPLLWFNIFALVFGNLFFIFLTVIAPLKRGWPHLCVFGLTAPVYWLLASVAAYKALWQIMFRPHYWEKTDHLISAVAIQKRKDALEDRSEK
jgi:glycosyltransferase XagB